MRCRFIRSTVATDMSDRGTMALFVSAASLKLIEIQIKLPPCIFDAGGGYWVVRCGCTRSTRKQMYTEMYTNNRIGSNALIINALIGCNGAEAQIRTGDTQIFNCYVVKTTNENNELLSHKVAVR